MSGRRARAARRAAAARAQQPAPVDDHGPLVERAAAQVLADEDLDALDRARAEQLLDQLYASLPGLACKGLCRDSCHNPDATEFERQRLAERGFTLPDALPFRVWSAMVDEIRAAGGTPPTCPALSAVGTCQVYDVRPYICRLFGHIPRCEHGCEPEAAVDVVQASRTALAIEALSRTVTGRARIPNVPGSRPWPPPSGQETRPR